MNTLATTLRRRLADVKAELDRLQPLLTSERGDESYQDARMALWCLTSHANLIDQLETSTMRDDHRTARFVRTFVGDPRQ